MNVLEAHVDPMYRNLSLRELLIANEQPITHPYYQQFERLRSLAIHILQRHITVVGEAERRISFSFLMNINKLWEVFLEETVMAELQTLGIEVRQERRYIYTGEESRDGWLQLIPDFTLHYDGEVIAVVDAKNKPRWATKPAREDLYQLFAYAYAYDSRYNGVLYPQIGESTRFDRTDRQLLHGHDPSTAKYFKKIPYTILTNDGSHSIEEEFHRYERQNEQLAHYLFEWFTSSE